MDRRVWSFACAVFALAMFAPGLAAQDAQASDETVTTTGHYTEEQAARGEETFESVCSYCHSDSQFSGSSFMRSWGGAPVVQLFQLISSTMPYDAPGSMSRQQYIDVVAYILSLNDVPAGEEELPTDTEVLEKILIEAPSAS